MQRIVNGEVIEVVGLQPLPPTDPRFATSGVVANAAAVATIAAVAGKTHYITGFDISAGGATAALLVQATLAGLLGGTATYIYGAVAGALLQSGTMMVRFATPVSASAANTAVTLTLPALGAGNTAACVNLFGFSV